MKENKGIYKKIVKAEFNRQCGGARTWGQATEIRYLWYI
jgi:hypothetical protein